MPHSPDRRSSEQALADELLEIHFESYGAGAASAEVHAAGDVVVAFLDGLQLLPNERFLAENGQEDLVLNIRRQYQAAIRATFVAAVERAVGRSVVHFFSETSLGDEPFSVEVFRLAPMEGAC